MNTQAFGHAYTDDPEATKLINPEYTDPKLKVSMRYNKQQRYSHEIMTGTETFSVDHIKDGDQKKKLLTRPLKSHLYGEVQFLRNLFKIRFPFKQR